MKCNSFIQQLPKLGLILALGSLLLTLPGVVGAQQPEDDIGAQGTAGQAFTYQGYLTDGSGPVSGTCDFTFGLYDAASGGTLVGGSDTQTGVPVNNGYFGVELNSSNEFGSNAFTGADRWLEITVNCGSGDTVLSPRQPLTAAPYAHSLRPGAAIRGSVIGGVLKISNLGSDGLTIETAGDDGVQVGYAADDGVYVSSANGDGVYVGTVGSPSTTNSSAGKNGFEVAGAEGFGLYVGQADDDGVRVHRSTRGGVRVDYSDHHGFDVYSAGQHGLYVHSAAGNGVHINSAGGNGLYGNGLYVGSANGDAVLVNSAEWSGVRVASAVNDGVSVDSAGFAGVAVYQADVYAGYFNGDVQVNGNLSKGGGSFKIDHPLDPQNKYLSHSFVESPDMLNLYNGNVTLDTNGEAWVELPAWFEALNREFRYQLTPIGGPGPGLYIAEKIENNRFKIGGGEPGLEVSWQVTGIRHDPYAEANRILVEAEKPAEERGSYLHPEAYGQPATMGLTNRLTQAHRLENAATEVRLPEAENDGDQEEPVEEPGHSD